MVQLSNEDLHVIAQLAVAFQDPDPEWVRMVLQAAKQRDVETEKIYAIAAADPMEGWPIPPTPTKGAPLIDPVPTTSRTGKGPRLSEDEIEAFAYLHVEALVEGPNLAGARSALQWISRQGIDARKMFDVLLVNGPRRTARPRAGRT